MRVTNKSEVELFCPFRRVTSHSGHAPPSPPPINTCTTIYHSTSPPRHPTTTHLAARALRPLSHSPSFSIPLRYLYNPTRITHSTPPVSPYASYASVPRSASIRIQSSRSSARFTQQVHSTPCFAQYTNAFPSPLHSRLDRLAGDRDWPTELSKQPRRPLAKLGVSAAENHDTPAPRNNATNHRSIVLANATP